jgi:hypothetical protein
MSQWWAVPMLLSGGLFVGGVVWIAWERVPAWRATDPVDFRSGFAHTLRRVDRLQPAPPPADVEALRARWLGGHLVRSAVALACFVLAVVATPRAGRPAPGASRVGHRRRCGRPRLRAGGLVHRPGPPLDRSAPVQGAGQVTDPSATQDHPGAPGHRQRPPRRLTADKSATPRKETLS